MHRHLFVLGASAVLMSSPGIGADPPAGAGARGIAAEQSNLSREDFRSAAVRHGAGATDADHAGIWKAAVPPAGAMQGEFDSNDPIGVAAGARIKADCSINWLDPDSGRRYCFSSATSLAVFLEAPHSCLARASARWDRMRGPAAGLK
jgi:hypothetical protein